MNEKIQFKYFQRNLGKNKFLNNNYQKGKLLDFSINNLKKSIVISSTNVSPENYTEHTGPIFNTIKLDNNVIFNNNRKYYLGNGYFSRSKPNKNDINMTIGGTVETDDDIVYTMKKEIEEEIGFNIYNNLYVLDNTYFEYKKNNIQYVIVNSIYKTESNNLKTLEDFLKLLQPYINYKNKIKIHTIIKVDSINSINFENHTFKMYGDGTYGKKINDQINSVYILPLSDTYVNQITEKYILYNVETPTKNYSSGLIEKSINFDQKFHNDLKWINTNKNRPLRIKGSYKIKEDGDILSDIDVESFVRYNETLLKIIYNIINKNKNHESPFTFIHLIVGKYKEFVLPWNIDNIGGCEYDREKVTSWFFEFASKNLVPTNILENIQKKIFSHEIKLSNLIEIENDLYFYSDIIWTPNDIRKGFKIIRNIRYDLLTEMKNETPVMEYIYKYGYRYINVDFALTDRNYRSEPTSKMHPFYTNNWYKIMKLFRWKLYNKDKQEYLSTMKQVEKIIAIIYQINTIENILFHNNTRYLNERINMNILVNKIEDNLSDDLIAIGINDMNNINEKLHTKINDILKYSIEYFSEKLKIKDKKLFKKYIKRGIQSQIPVTPNIINIRKSIGIKCPFFTQDIEEYDKLSELAIRLCIPQDKMFDCYFRIAKNNNKKLDVLVEETYPNNNLSIIIDNDKIILRNNIDNIGIFDKKYLTYIQKYIMMLSYTD